MIIAPDNPNLSSALLDARFTRRYLAEGDSWFSIGGITGNLLMALDDDVTLIVNCASPGDTMTELGRGAFSRMLATTDGMPSWDAVLLSAGGNDLLQACRHFVVPYPSGPIDYDALVSILNGIESQMVRLLVLCRSGQPGVPVYIHTYDHPPISRRWWFWQAGPWVSPVLQMAGIDRSRWDGLSAMLIDLLAERMHRIAVHWTGLNVIETRGRLCADDWKNEIHPKTTGYHDLAQVWRRTLNH